MPLVSLITQAVHIRLLRCLLATTYYLLLYYLEVVHIREPLLAILDGRDDRVDPTDPTETPRGCVEKRYSPLPQLQPLSYSPSASCY